MTIYSVDDLKNYEKMLALKKGAIIESDSDLVFTTELLDRLDEFVFKKRSDLVLRLYSPEGPNLLRLDPHRFLCSFVLIH